MKILLVLLVLLPYQVFSQTLYSLTSKFNDPKTKEAINFTLTWSESDGTINGNYKDDSLTNDAIAKGAIGDKSRIFRVSLEKNPKDISAITILISETNNKSKNIPLSIVTQDKSGSPQAMQTTGSISMIEAQAQVARSCEEGFGDLRGFCGMYEGLIAEELDSDKKCTLAGENPPRLELDENGTLLFHVGPINDLVQVPNHSIGRIPYDPDSVSIDIMGRECRPLVGVDFNGDACKRLNLIGTFINEDGNRRFAGVYNIIDEDKNRRCTYRLSLERMGP